MLDPEVGGEGVTLQARQNYEISCHGHKPLTWIIPGLNNNSDRQKRSVEGVKKVLSPRVSYLATILVPEIIFHFPEGFEFYRVSGVNS